MASGIALLFPSIFSDDNMLYLTPCTGAFDAARVGRQVLTLGHPLQYTLPRAQRQGELYMVFLTADDREVTRAALATDSCSSLPHVLLLDVAPGEISINGFCGDTYASYVQAFLRWLMKDTPFNARWPTRDAAYVNPRIEQFCAA